MSSTEDIFFINKRKNSNNYFEEESIYVLALGGSLLDSNLYYYSNW
jgi:hypothetical protein